MPRRLRKLRSRSPIKRELLGVIFRTRIEQSVDWKRYVIDTERAMAADTVAILGVLACVAAAAGNGFAVTNRGEKLKSRHGFPLNMWQAKLSECGETSDGGGRTGSGAWCLSGDTEAICSESFAVFALWPLVKDWNESRLQELSIRAELSAHFEDGFHVEVAGIGDMCKPRRRAGEN